MDEYMEKYINFIKSKNLSKNTIEAYSNDLEKFFAFLNNREEQFNEVDEILIMSYVQQLIKEGIANSSINRNLVTLRNFYKFLLQKHLIIESPMINYELPKIKRNLPEILTIEEMNTLLNLPDTATYKGVRDRAMLELMYATGIKVTELLNLRIFDVNLNMEYMVCKGSKEKERIIPLGSVAIRYVREYLDLRKTISNSESLLLFLNSRGNKMSRQGFWKIVKAYAKEAGIDKDINLYTFRHSFAVHLLQNGADIKSVQELLGHVDISTTEIYYSITKKNKLIEVYKKAHPRA
ncbi:site-specific tyrosine recombinase XerD [Clostridium algidicarnis]|uniref:Tyrosine recombinase XerC n=2 Tax=Clostridium algidicarnis TaxID=37659 RepID=A0A2S6FXV3_9CLOT|nr:site-specific tyrosine recombinase XerD [Clostridium algidicarnis]MBB6631294.1 site-specific tyrosine recombinase XerD [Clostridium algidicarnis]MBB6697587.1 site-specific tyrosine recombinase XerD [Clostridium algidicarnis]MBU3203325.1 site-specific tyrosine recombinase XerD [Clostridium algidicarnis]MBU3205380.1 site-specific tyrosine recombinase XerD [Clostridium algidicarnis]MBU3211479.1 site-specific tyrosine recombinase XerD [Clostridium algidicarnis]